MDKKIDRKEVFDYLRNKQKSAEIEAKVNGINIWVLLAAVAVVIWQLVDVVDFMTISGNAILFSSMLLLSQGVCNISEIVIGQGRVRNDIRFIEINFAEFEAPFLMLLHGIIFLIPAVVAFSINGLTLGVGIAGFFSVSFFVLGLTAIGSRIFEIRSSKKKFPAPNFGYTSGTDITFDLIYISLFVVVVVEQVAVLWNHRSILTQDMIKQLLLISVLYILTVIVVQQKRRSKSIAWTYELETDLLLCNIDVDDAAKKIEYRGVGRLLQDVMDNFFFDLDRRINELDGLFEKCELKVGEIKKIPEQYEAEIASRTRECTGDLKKVVESLKSDCEEFKDYLVKIKEKNIGSRKKVLTPYLAGLKEKYDENISKINAAEIRLKNILK